MAKRVEFMEQYFYITDIGEIDYHLDVRDEIDDKMFEVNNYFNSKEDAISSELYRFYNREGDDK